MKYLLLTLALFNIYICFSQDQFEPLYLGKDYNYYLNSEMRIEKKEKYPREIAFYLTFEEAKRAPYQRLPEDRIAYPLDRYSTNLDSLISKSFTVDNIYQDTSPIFTLRDIETNQVLYFKYDIDRDWAFPFIVKLKTNKKDIACSQIDRFFLTFAFTCISHYKYIQTYLNKTNKYGEIFNLL